MRLSDRALSISPSPTLAIDARAKEMASRGDDVVNFGVGEPDFDTPEHIKEAAIEAIRRGASKYTPVPGTLALRKAVAAKLKRDTGLDYEPGDIVISVGAKHSLYNIVQVLCQHGDEVILPVPYWVSYLEQIKLAGATPRLIPTSIENGFKIRAEDLQGAITSRSRLLILNSPSNPTGAVYTREELAELVRVLQDHPELYVISDEIYEKLVYDGQVHVSIASLAAEIKDRTIVVNGVSKAYAMTGWRIGFTASAAAIAKAMTGLQSHSTSNPTAAAQAAAVAALDGPDEPIREMVSEFNRRREYMLGRMQSLPGIQCPRPGGAFYLFPSVQGLLGKELGGRPIRNASDLANALLEEARVAAVPGVAFGDDTCIRFSYATSMERIIEGMDRFEALVRKLT